MEITAYALLAMIEAGRIKQSYPIFQWLLWQRSDRGGFEGTQDTVVGLQALAAYAKAVKHTVNDMSIDVSAIETDLGLKNAAKPEIKSVKVSADNALVLQKLEVSLLKTYFTEHNITFAHFSYRKPPAQLTSKRKAMESH